MGKCACLLPLTYRVLSAVEKRYSHKMVCFVGNGGVGGRKYNGCGRIDHTSKISAEAMGGEISKHAKLRSAFEAIYGHEPSEISFSPGRVNLIGEHIDYNGGMVLPAAISLGIWAAVGR